MQWAEHCVRHAEAYFRLLCSVSDPSELRLTAVDEVIFDKFLEMFGDIPLDVISEDSLKSGAIKSTSLPKYYVPYINKVCKWRIYCNEFEGKVEDFNLGTLFRLDASKGYCPENTCIVPRIQFLALETARNRLGINKPENLRQLHE
ncbi:Protein PBDC1 [Schistosoma japonicum]|uniref:Protein PBDC1 n=1 Tax=Schistosoma japonicum TaxID=6182 RepID=A0A4Z2DL97_SCHJA|nr:Protein PBDC1 [Schistosoma japonicum]